VSVLVCLAHELEVDEFAARPEEDRLTAAEKNERINKQLQVIYITHASSLFLSTDNIQPKTRQLYVADFALVPHSDELDQTL